MMTPILAELQSFTIDTVLSPYMYTFLSAYMLSFIFTPIMRGVAEYYGVIDKPDLHRKMHSQPVAYLGGVAVFIGWLGGLAISQFSALHYWKPEWDGHGYPGHVLIPRTLIVAAFMIILLGLWDDLRSLNARYKIMGQIAAACVLIAGHIGTSSTGPLLAPILERVRVWFGIVPPPWIVYITSCMLVVVLVVFCCNATNLMDGLDGLCGGVTAIIAAGFLFLVTNMAVKSGPGDWLGLQSSALRITLALALLGGVMAFVPYNFNPASIFMGDAGSMFLGFSLCVLILTMAEIDTRWLLASLVMFALPMLDTALAFARRFVNKRPVFSADKQHFHHQLVSRGMSVRKAVIIAYLLTVGFVILGSAIVYVRTRYAMSIYMVVFCSIIVTAYKMGMIHERATIVRSGKSLGPSDAIAVPSNESGSVLEILDKNKK